MSTTQQPEALRDARWYMIDKDGMATLCADREDAEKEAKNANMAWPHTAPHRAVQLVEVADVEALRTGYAAARLEIESLRARSPIPPSSGEYPALPEPDLVSKQCDSTMRYTTLRSFSEDKLRAFADATCAMRAAQPAGAQQPGAAYAALPDADRDYMRKVVAVAVTMLFDGYKEDVTRVFSTGELSEFVTITTAMGAERVEDIYRRAWDLLSLPVRASHGQAPAQAAPQQEAASVDLKTMELAESVGLIGPASRTNDLHAAIQRFHDLICANATIKAAQMAAEAISEAAPQADPLQPIVALQEQAGMYADDFAPQADSVTAPAAGAVAHTISDAQIEAMPVWRNFVGLWPESRREIVDAVVDLLAAGATAPAAQAADSVLEDAVRLDWLLLRISGAEFRRIGVHYSGNARRADVDAARKKGANHD